MLSLQNGETGEETFAAFSFTEYEVTCDFHRRQLYCRLGDVVTQSCSSLFSDSARNKRKCTGTTWVQAVY
jgi:hypothetical protein